MLRIVCGVVMMNVLAGCASLALGREERDPRPHLLVQGQEWNAALLNPRPPEYGIAEPAGCVVQREFHVQVDQLAYDPATGRLRLSGRLFDSRDGRGTFGTLRTRNDDGAPVAALVSPDAFFSLDLLLAQNPTLAIQGIGFRPLWVNLRALSRRAARASASADPSSVSTSPAIPAY